jgi:ubiquinone/menaquinone biosynthesis C-methylase UbiE
MSRIAFIPDDTDELKKWHKELAAQFLKKIGVQQGNYILDFGCGIGSYALPAANFVGKNGKVYAIDNEQICIDEIEKSIATNHLKDIIVPLKTEGEFSFQFDNNIMDFVFLVDVLGVILHHTNSLKAIEELISEIARVIKPSGTLLIIYKHVNHWRHPKEKVESIITRYFSLQEELDLLHVHWDFLENGLVNLYKKK